MDLNYKCCVVFQGAGVFCIMTKLIITENQFQGKCAEVRTRWYHWLPVSFSGLLRTYSLYLKHFVGWLWAILLFKVSPEPECNGTSTVVFSWSLFMTKCDLQALHHPAESDISLKSFKKPLNLVLYLAHFYLILLHGCVEYLILINYSIQWSVVSVWQNAAMVAVLLKDRIRHPKIIFKSII